MYVEPKIESSYQKNNLGYTIYETVLRLKYFPYSCTA